MARDRFHNAVRAALERDGWLITDDPLRVKSGDVKGEIDLGAEKIIGAEKDGRRIAVEIKGFTSPSPVADFEDAYGQFSLYRWILRKEKSDRALFLAVPKFAFESFFQRPLIVEIVEAERINLLIFNHLTETIESWKSW